MGTWRRLKCGEVSKEKETNCYIGPGVDEGLVGDQGSGEVFVVCLRSCLSDDDGILQTNHQRRGFSSFPVENYIIKTHNAFFFFFGDYNLRLIRYRSSLIVHWTKTTELIYSLNVGNVRSCKLRI